MIKKFLRIPIKVEAVQAELGELHNNIQELRDFCLYFSVRRSIIGHTQYVYYWLENEQVKQGDWIVKSPDGVFHVSTDERMSKIYEEIE